MCVILGPLFLFVRRIGEAELVGLGEYGAWAARYVREFDARWLRGNVPPNEPPPGSAGIPSLADLSNSFNIVRTMNFVPISTKTIFRLAAITLLPLAPLVLTIIPLEELIKRLLGILF
jgi:hypothetical protein